MHNFVDIESVVRILNMNRVSYATRVDVSNQSIRAVHMLPVQNMYSAQWVILVFFAIAFFA